MIRPLLLVPAIFALLLTPLVAAGESPEISATETVIDRLNLTPAPYPISRHPRWQPSRIVVSLPPRLGKDMPGYALELQEAAGDTTLVLDTSGAFVPSAETLAGADAYIGFCTTGMLANADESLLWVHSYTVGMDRCSNADEALLGDRVFTNNKRLSGPTIAEHSIAMLLSISRGLPAYTAAQARREWRPELAAKLEFGELAGKTMLIAGLGGIGTEIARRAHGLGMRVIATRHSSREGPDFVSYVGLSDELEALAAKADVVVNSLPLTQETRGLFDRAFFALVKPGAIFITVGRGQSTVTADLVAALASGHLYGAGLDVTDPEPLPADSPLWLLPNVIITPHVAAAGGASLQRTALIATENLRRYVSGEALLNLVDMEEGY
ncbi:D-2-hydroxyacid dehydrogenase [Kineobactrum sediminis]|uniref:D-2-hydroxyacid dehydrogenase n=1 Tax=Kineobactrum sediminis TaxID=1905677 RepID=A0A2N5Y738_9GAMM|nr:D-2-hydroxyacid dehydrogenase [Kineobactrum sediminis]PLW84204.1 D-2-hydroxyacid dehydrogenase [Kineobactrum sediminis]